ncbi:MAG: insulinase family protein, partial [Rhodospirillaceae bacterium]|nr:insulinase family protein [Rhodospirillaceae bacterium]
FSQIVDRLGGSDNAFTNQDMTAYHQEVAREHLATIMAMEADRMVHLRLDSATVLSERDVILNERSQVIDNNPSSRLREAVNAAIYRNHPYGRPVIGWRHEIAAYDLGDAQGFYKQWYAPNNAILIVAGDVAASEVRQLAETHFGAIPARAVPTRQRLREPPPVAARRLSLSSPEVRYPSVTRSYLAPSYRSAALADTVAPLTAETPYALAILGEILSSGAVGRLHRKLVLDQGIAIGVSAGYSGDMRDYGSFSFSVAPRDTEALDAVEAALDTEIANLLAEGISEEELAAAKQRLMIESVKARDGLAGPASLVAYALGADSTLADLQAWPDRIAAVKSDSVMTAARTVLTPANSVTAILLPEPTGTATVPAP